MKAVIRCIFFFVILYETSCTYGVLKSDDVRNHLGTRTPYRFKLNEDDSRIKYPNCKDGKIWMIVRHGTRLPSANDIIGINNTLRNLKYHILDQHKSGKGFLSKVQLKTLEGWKSNIVVEKQKYLTEEGQDEMVSLSQRMQNRFPNAIQNKYNKKTFLFRYTATERAQQSARYFTKGLFNKRDNQDVVFAPVEEVDTVLRFYKHCDRWQKQVKKNPHTKIEQNSFAGSSRMNNTLESISKKLGLDTSLDFDTVNLMYKICGYETSWNKHLSPWCYGFDLQSIKDLEYYHDLKHYWLDGYGHNLTYQQACLSVQHMFETFSKENSPNATFLFAHSGTLLKILSHLQLYKPETPLLSDVVQNERTWRASNIDCFATNLAFILYKCKDGDHVLALHQERIIKLPMCDKQLCPLKHLMEKLHDSIHGCNYSDMCSLSRNDEL